MRRLLLVLAMAAVMLDRAPNFTYSMSHSRAPGGHRSVARVKDRERLRRHVEHHAPSTTLALPRVKSSDPRSGYPARTES
jgi:hypothetical protein